MRSRIIQPRTLFRIAGGSGSGSSSSAGASAAAVAASSNNVAATATATALRTRTTPPLVRHHHQHTPSIQARISARTTRSPASTLTDGTGSKVNGNGNAASSGSGEQGAQSSSGNSNRRGSHAQTASKSTSPPLSLRHPIVPVYPPPHSSRSVALQSFFSQGRPLLEHNNMDTAGLISTSGDGPTRSIAMVLDMLPQDGRLEEPSTLDPLDRASLVAEVPSFSNENGQSSDADMEATTQGVAEVLGQFTSTSSMEQIVQRSSGGGMDALQSLPEDVQARIRARAAALVRSMKEIEEHLSKVEVKNGEMLMPPALTSSSVSLQFHLPPLSAVTKSAFEEILDNAMASEGQRKGPITMHTVVSTRQAFERERQRLINEAQLQEMDTRLASALGPESELVVLGEPEGPRADWGRGVTSYLARHGQPFEPPPAPRGGAEAARLQQLEDMTVFDVSTTSAERVPASNGQQKGDQDSDLWLQHALVQEKMKSAIEWSRLVTTMEGKRSLTPSGSATETGMNSLLDLSSLNATLPQATMEQVIHMDSVKRKKRKKMRKMKYKKLRKRQRAERQRLKK